MRIKVCVKTGAKENKVEKKGDLYRVSLKQKPVKGRANLALQKLLKEHFFSEVKIVSGFKSKNKTVEILGRD